MPTCPLYVPADRPAMLQKAASRGSDLIVIDLEDSVPLASKPAARASIEQSVRDLKAQGAAVAVRINIPVAERVQDLAALESAPVDTLMVPKATSSAIQEIAEVGGWTSPMIALIESGEGLLEARDIAVHPQVTHLAIGEADLAADLDMVAGDSDPAWIPSRMHLVWASAAAGLAGPIGPVYVDLADLDGLRASTERLKAMGFSGRSAIHPAQVEVISDVFRPSSEDLEAARRLVAKYDAALAEGRGVILDGSGSIVDEAVVRRARRLLSGD